MKAPYEVLVIDPPWQQQKSGKRKVRPDQERAFDYPVMSTQDIFWLLDREIFIQATRTHCVFMWTIDKYLLECEAYMIERNYKRHARFIWDKCNGMAPAFTIRYSHEYLIWYYQSSLLTVAADMRGKFTTVFTEPARSHSRKPDKAYIMIEQLYPDANKIDVFSREKRKGWAQFGNQTNYFMKLILIIHLCLVAAIYGCRDARPVMIQEFIPGTYIRFSSHEYGKEYDTLTISKLNATANEYTITRRWRYERTDENPNYQLITTAGIYYPDEKVLEDMESGDLLTFDPKQSCVFIGTLKYQKL